MPGHRGRHDFGAADGASALAVEVTSDPDDRRLAQREAPRMAGAIDLGTRRHWHLCLYPRANVKKLRTLPRLRDFS